MGTRVDDATEINEEAGLATSYYVLDQVELARCFWFVYSRGPPSRGAPDRLPNAYATSQAAEIDSDYPIHETYSKQHFRTSLLKLLH